MNTSENGKYSSLNSRHASPVEETGFLDIISPDSPSPVMSLVQLRGFWGIFPGRVVSDLEALAIPKSRIVKHIPPGAEVDFLYDDEGLLRGVYYYDENGPYMFDGLTELGIGKVPVRLERIEYDDEGGPGDTGPIDRR